VTTGSFAKFCPLGVATSLFYCHLVSDKDGEAKVYIMHFHDLSQRDWQKLARQFQKWNKDSSILMTDKEKKGLLG